jgi:glutamyl-tRNA synthetase
MASEIRVRFAPSPTGYLHIGGARTALFNWLFARHHGGKFVLRIEDTDIKRNTEEAMTAIYEGLEWLGLNWDEGPHVGGDLGPYLQSERTELYERYLKKLQDAGHIFEDQGAMRFRSPREHVVVDDIVCGKIDFDLSNPATHPDMTIRRPDGSWIFHFVNVIDDLEMKISHVIRGEDHLSNTPKHIEIFRALGGTPPHYAHIPLILNRDGTKMSKRDEGARVEYYIQRGYLPAAVRNYLCLLGWSPKGNREKIDLDEIIRIFDLKNIGRSSATFDPAKLRWLNGEYILGLDSQTYRKQALAYLKMRRIPVQQFQDVDEAIATSRGKIKVFEELPGYLKSYTKGRRYISLIDETAGIEAVDYYEFAYDSAAARKYFTRENENVLFAVRDALATLDQFDAATVESTVKRTAALLNVKIGALVHPLRLAFTGDTVGPSLYHLMAIFGKEKVIQLINRAIDKIGNRRIVLSKSPASSKRADEKRH